MLAIIGIVYSIYQTRHDKAVMRYKYVSYTAFWGGLILAIIFKQAFLTLIGAILAAQFLGIYMSKVKCYYGQLSKNVVCDVVLFILIYLALAIQVVITAPTW